MGTDADRRCAGLLLVGPTGSGKTPLGCFLERHGLRGRRCVHFDFGAGLREAASGGPSGQGLNAAEVAFVRDVLDRGALLEKETFYIAAGILGAFLERKNVDQDTLVVMNGLPRHVAQARDVDRLVRIDEVLYLDCPAAVVRERIERDSGGDRSGRTDDSVAEVDRKLRTFHERTVPILNHYRQQGASVTTVSIGVDTQPPDVLAELEAM